METKGYISDNFKKREEYLEKKLKMINRRVW